MKNITWRAVLAGLILIRINAYWIVLIETVYYSAHSTTIGFFFNPIFTLLFLIALNAPLIPFLLNNSAYSDMLISL